MRSNVTREKKKNKNKTRTKKRTKRDKPLKDSNDHLRSSGKGRGTNCRIFGEGYLMETYPSAESSSSCRSSV